MKKIITAVVAAAAFLLILPMEAGAQRKVFKMERQIPEGVGDINAQAWKSCLAGGGMSSTYVNIKANKIGEENYFSSFYYRTSIPYDPNKILAGRVELNKQGTEFSAKVISNVNITEFEECSSDANLLFRVQSVTGPSPNLPTRVMSKALVLEEVSLPFNSTDCVYSYEFNDSNLKSFMALASSSNATIQMCLDIKGKLENTKLLAELILKNNLTISVRFSVFLDESLESWNILD